MDGALDVFATVLFLNWFILSDFQNANDFAQWIAVSIQMILWGIVVFLFFASIILLVGFNRNMRVKGECIVYYAKNDKLVLTTLNERRIEIRPSQYVKASWDGFLEVCYRGVQGDKTKVVLGVTTNFDYVEERLNEICSRK